MARLSERVYPLDSRTLDVFASKSTQDGPCTAQQGNANGVKVRRVMQITSDLTKIPFDELKIMDFGCGEGVYAIEAALRGADVLAIDGRTERMAEGAKAAKRLALTNLRFEQLDIRQVDVGSHGQADVIFFLGILYHLDHHDVFPVLQNLSQICRQFMIIDTHIALQGQTLVQHNGQKYYGQQFREHADDDPEKVRRSRLMASLDNPLSFCFTKNSLFKLLNDVGFTCVCECNVPLEPFKPKNRITAIATKGERVKLSSYPWVNDKTEEDISRFLADSAQSPRGQNTRNMSIRRLAKSLTNGALRNFGLELRRIHSDPER